MAWAALISSCLALPTYVGCDLKTDVNYMGRDLGRQLDIGEPLMSTTIVEANMQLQFTPSIADGYKQNTEYTVEVVNAVEKGGGAYHVTAGTLADTIDKCATTGRIGQGAKPTFKWTSPESGTVTFTYLSANFGQAYMSRAQVSDTSFTFESAEAEEVPELTCRNKSLTGSKRDERWMIFGLALVWVLGVHVSALSCKPRSMWLQYAMSVALVAWGATFASTADYGNTDMYLAMFAYLIASAVNLYRSYRHFLRDLWRWFVLTLLFVSSLTSFHHWCNGEQDWDEMTGDWGDWDSWQGTIPWWAAANIIAVWTVYSKKTFKKVYALQILLGIVSFAAFQPWNLKGKDVPKWQIGTVSAFFGVWVPISVYYLAVELFGKKGRENRRQQRERILQKRLQRTQEALENPLKPVMVPVRKQMIENSKKTWKRLHVASWEFQIVFVGTCVFFASMPAFGIESGAKAYADISTIIMMICCAVVGLSWGISSVATHRARESLRSVEYKRLGLCVRPVPTRG